MDLKHIRDEFLQNELDIKQLADHPIDQLNQWFQQALKSNIRYPNAANLATVDDKGMPHSRMILVKGIEKSGITFFTDYSSDKGKQIKNNPNVCINIFWKEFDRQVRINGKVKKVSRLASEQYFQSRPKESQISATASSQSHPVDKKELIKTVENLKEQYHDQKALPCPADWGGYLLSVKEFEFWQGRPNRLHDRFKYQLQNERWNIFRVSP